jgi:hypothetical protein
LASVPPEVRWPKAQSGAPDRRIAEHAGELQAGLQLQLDGDRRGLLADVVRVVGQRQHLRRQAREQQVGDHVAEVARAVEGHRALQRRRQRVQLAAQARFEGLEGRAAAAASVGIAGGSSGWTLRRQ